MRYRMFNAPTPLTTTGDRPLSTDTYIQCDNASLVYTCDYFETMRGMLTRSCVTADPRPSAEAIRNKINDRFPAAASSRCVAGHLAADGVGSRRPRAPVRPWP